MAVYCLAVTAKGTRLLTGSWQSIMLWDISSGQRVASFGAFHTDYVSCLVVTPDGRGFVSGSADRCLALWRLEESLQLQQQHWPVHSFRGHTGPVTCAVISSDGNRLFSGSSDKSIRMWDMVTATQLALWPQAHVGSAAGVRSLVLISPSRLLSCGGVGIKIWQLDSVAGQLQLLSTLQGPDAVWQIAANTRGDRVISFTFENKGLRLWDAACGQQLAAVRNAHSGIIRSVIVSSDGSLAASCGEDGTVALWELNSDNLVKRSTLRGGSGFVHDVLFVQ